MMQIKILGIKPEYLDVSCICDDEKTIIINRLLVNYTVEGCGVVFQGEHRTGQMNIIAIEQEIRDKIANMLSVLAK